MDLQWQVLNKTTEVVGQTQYIGALTIYKSNVAVSLFVC